MSEKIRKAKKCNKNIKPREKVLKLFNDCSKIFLKVNIKHYMEKDFLRT